MSIAIPRSGSFVLDNLFGKIIIDPTTPETMWGTTLAKFGPHEKERLARHIIQVRVTGDGETVRGIKLRATEYGVELKPAEPYTHHGGRPGRHAPGNGNGDPKPLVFRCTVPVGTALHFRNTYGSIVVGDLDNEVRANLAGGTKFRVGRIAHASLTMRGASMAYLTRVVGTVDALLNGSAKALLDGEIEQLRAVLEKNSVIEIVGEVGKLQAEVMGNGFLHAKQAVSSVRCNAHDNGYIRIAELKKYLVGHRTERARIDVLKKPLFVPVRRYRGRGYAFAGA
jgi:hypothetical protein